MTCHWYQATLLLETLVEKAAGLDEDGMDLRFTAGTTSLDGKKSAEKFVECMNKARPMKGTSTDLRSSLGDELDAYESRLKDKQRHPTKPVKNMVLIVLTDGSWADMDWVKDGVANQRTTFCEKLKGLPCNLKQRPFSIQFIQFGNDDAATQRLVDLDDYLDRIGME